MSRGGLPALDALEVADPPDVWRRLGFVVAPDGACRIGDVTIQLVGKDAGKGILGWTLRAATPLPEDLDGIPTRAAPAGQGEEPHAPPAPAHPNGATRVDHVVVSTPDLERTLAALGAAGLQVRRLREAGTADRPLRQAFLWAGDVLLEVAGDPAAHGPGPARLWGLVVVTPSLEDLPARTDRAVGSIREAVQVGRRITTVRREVGSSVPLAFMTPHLRA